MHRVSVWIMGALLIAVAPALKAQSLHKCVGRTGQVSYQSQPCAPGSRTAWVREATPEPAPSAERRAAMRREKARRDVESEYLAGLARRRRGAGSGHTINTLADADGCAAARRHRDRELERVGLDRTFDLLRRLDDRVAKACR